MKIEMGKTRAKVSVQDFYSYLSDDYKTDILTAISITRPRQSVAMETAVATPMRSKVMTTWRINDFGRFEKKPTSITWQ